MKMSVLKNKFLGMAACFDWDFSHSTPSLADTATGQGEPDFWPFSLAAN